MLVQPYACITCLRLGFPCVVNLGSFVGCYNCKKRNQKCSLTPRVNEGKMNNLRLCWWIAVMQHIQGILELGTMQGSIGILPDYGPTNITAATIPRWALAAAGNIRKEMQGKEVSDRWDHLVAHVIPHWRFYAMPHSVLVSLGPSRPRRPYWPDTGDNKVTIQHVLRILQEGRNGTLARLFAVNVEDGYNYHATIRRGPKQPKRPDTKKRGKGQDQVKDSDATKQKPAPTTTGRGSKGKKNTKARSPVPSQTDPDEGQPARTGYSVEWY